MTIEELKARRDQVQTALTQNHFTLQGHLSEIDFQIAEINKAIEDAAKAEVDAKAKSEQENDLPQSPVNQE